MNWKKILTFCALAIFFFISSESILAQSISLPNGTLTNTKYCTWFGGYWDGQWTSSTIDAQNDTVVINGVISGISLHDAFLEVGLLTDKQYNFIMNNHPTEPEDWFNQGAYMLFYTWTSGGNWSWGQIQDYQGEGSMVSLTWATSYDLKAVFKPNLGSRGGTADLYMNGVLVESNHVYGKPQIPGWWASYDTTGEEDFSAAHLIIQLWANSSGKSVSYSNLRAQFIPPEVWVDDDYNSSTPGWGYDHFDKIQDGVNAVASGGTVHVYSGNYIEQLTIQKDLTLEGVALSPKPKIIAPAVRAPAFQIAESGRWWDPVIFMGNKAGAAAFNITVKGFEIDGLNLGTAASTFVAILARNASPGTLRDCDVLNFHNPVNSDRGSGIMVYGNSNFTVRNNMVSSFSKNGITANGDFGAAPDPVVIIDSNAVTGDGFINTVAQNGIQVGFGAGGTVQANHISNIGWIWNGSGTQWVSSGILPAIWGTPGPSVNCIDNIITDVQVGIYYSDGTGNASGNHYTMTNSDGLGPYAYYSGILACDPLPAAPIPKALPFEDKGTAEASEGQTPYKVAAILTYDISNNILLGDSKNSSEGIYFFNWSGGSHTLVGTATDNTVKGFGSGLNSHSDGSTVNVTFHDNLIECNQIVGIYLAGGTTGSSVYNNKLIGNVQNAQDDGIAPNAWDNGSAGNFWDDWASNSGFPTQYNVPGTAGSVDHYPLPNPSVVWVDDDWAGTPCGDSVGGHLFGYDAFDKIKDGIDHVGGSTVNVLPGTYNESDTISKSVTLNGDPGDANPGPGPNAPVLDGTGFSGAPAFCITQGISNVTIQGFEIRNYGPNGNTNADGVVAWNSGTTNITVRDNYMHHLGYAGVLAGNGWGGPQGLHDNWNVTANIIDNFGAYALDLENTKNTKASNNQISSPTFATNQALMILALADPGKSITSSNITISGNTFTNYPDRVICLVEWAQDAAASATLENITIKANNINTNFYAISPWKLGSGTNTIRNLIVSGNTIAVDNPKSAGYAVELFDVVGTSSFDSNTVTLTGVIGGGGTFFHGINVGGAQTGTWTFANNQLDGNNVGSQSCGFRLRSSLPATSVLNITGNILTEFADGIRSDALNSGTDINVYNNNLAGNSDKGVLNGAGEMIDASGNWWGSNLPVTVRTSANDGVKVDYTPWLDTDLDTQPSTPGFQGDFSVLWVDDNSLQSGSTGRIQEGVNLVVGSTVKVLPGSYNENIVINKSLILLGAGQDSVIIYPAVSDIGQPNPEAGPSFRGSQMCVVQASNVTIDGFTFDGDSPTLTPLGTLDARNGIITNYYSGDWSSLKVQNCTVKNIYLRGIYASGNNLTGIDFNHNTVSNVKGVSMQSAGLMLYGSSGNVKHNNLSNTSLGIFYHMYSDGNIDSNNVTTSEVCLGANSNDAVTSISYNTVTNSPQGIQTVSTLAPINVTFNNVTDCTTGVVLYGGGTAQANVWDNNIDGLGYYSTYGVWGSTDLTPWGLGDLSANLKRNTVKDNFYGIVLNEPSGDRSKTLSVLIGGASTDRNFVYNNTNYELLLEYCNDDQTATYNYWGKSAYALIEDEIYHKVDQPDLGLVTFGNAILHGDVNLDGHLSVADVVYLVNYLFKGGPAPQLFVVADVNRDGKLTVADAVYLINYLFKGGPAPKIIATESAETVTGKIVVDKSKLSKPVNLHSVEK